MLYVLTVVLMIMGVLMGVLMRDLLNLMVTEGLIRSCLMIRVFLTIFRIIYGLKITLIRNSF